MLGLRYQVLSGPAWLTVNNVFHAMRAARRTDGSLKLLETELPEDHDAPPQSITELFLAIQMVSRFDVLMWPTELHQFLFAY